MAGFFFSELLQPLGSSVGKSKKLFRGTLKSSKLDIHQFLLLRVFLSAMCLWACTFTFLLLTHGSPVVVEDVIHVHECITNFPLLLLDQMHQFSERNGAEKCHR